MPSGQDILTNLIPMKMRARKENLLFCGNLLTTKTCLTPEELDNKNAIGEFIWGPGYWTLIPNNKEEMVEEGGISLTFLELLKANYKRSKLWHDTGTGHWSLSDWGVALAGEVGEALNIIKKLNRDRNGMVGNTKSKEELTADLGEELADVMIYLDLLALEAGVDLEEEVVKKFNKTSEKHGFDIKL